jgi:hypothetical protein
VKVKFLIIERRVFFSNAYQILSLGVGVVKWRCFTTWRNRPNRRNCNVIIFYYCMRMMTS